MRCDAADRGKPQTQQQQASGAKKKPAGPHFSSTLAGLSSTQCKPTINGNQQYFTHSSVAHAHAQKDGRKTHLKHRTRTPCLERPQQTNTATTEPIDPPLYASQDSPSHRPRRRRVQHFHLPFSPVLTHASPPQTAQSA
jgi:hypothetical protein